MGWLGTQTDSQNPQSPTRDQALGYCREWASTMGPSHHDGNFVIAPMSQLGVACQCIIASKTSLDSLQLISPTRSVFYQTCSQVSTALTLLSQNRTEAMTPKIMPKRHALAIPNLLQQPLRRLSQSG